jgi:hypothetical protein
MLESLDFNCFSEICFDGMAFNRRFCEFCSEISLFLQAVSLDRNATIARPTGPVRPYGDRETLFADTMGSANGL